MTKMKKISEWCYRNINVKIFLAVAIIFVLFMILVLPQVAEHSYEVTGTKSSPDTSFYYTASILYEIAEAYGEQGRVYYISSRFTFDVIWPIVYGVFLIAALTFVYQRISIESRWRRIHLLPFVGVGFDFLENIGASIVMARYPKTTPIIAELTPVFTLLKWISIYASFFFLLVGLTLWMVGFFKKLQSNTKRM
ncbi:hypothetical protein [Desulfuribacillus alkaliarsenatis]|uniref:Uncharacterized protein n=1 Tax=Desulfuribacillus alkaliarsenatis TaxID=766136 RepID=A0A1E5G0Z0_9FIRM|nr:hypothetical protein [Desulfuribacillus alkaliarsenatis]OEF96578.1 hypothetical protein BHF68_07995 [Desulfuribacillus alkaliarsenatis]